MRTHWLGACLLLTGVLGGPASDRAHAQEYGSETDWRSSIPAARPTGATLPHHSAVDFLGASSAGQPIEPAYIARAQWDVSGYENTPVPTWQPFGPGRMDDGGFYGALEFLFMHGTRAIGSQQVAVRGFVDSDGSLGGASGVFFGSRGNALDTASWGRTTWTPGFRLTLGYKFADGVAFSVSYAHLYDAQYSAGAGPIPESFNTQINTGNADALLFAPVFNFSPQYSGPQKFTNGIGSGLSPYGIWNGANTMDIKFTQRFTNWDVTARVPVVETDYSRSYALAGGRFAWIWEGFSWRTVSSNAAGVTRPEDAARYSNIISQRMYGPFLGCGNEVYLGSAFSFTADLTGSLLYSIVKERAKYIRDDETTQAKRSRLEYTIVPNVNIGLNLWWYPIQNIQLRAGYDIMAFFNTIYMDQPIGFNQGQIDPSYANRFIRIYHGFHVGVGINF